MLSYIYRRAIESPWGLLFILMILLTIVLAMAFPEARY